MLCKCGAKMIALFTSYVCDSCDPVSGQSKTLDKIPSGWEIMHSSNNTFTDAGFVVNGVLERDLSFFPNSSYDSIPVLVPSAIGIDVGNNGWKRFPKGTEIREYHA